MEYADGGELFDLIVDRHKLREELACQYFRSLVFGLKYIHSLNVCHRDLKPENLLLDASKDLKIVDFGLSNAYKVKGKDLLKTACGSPCYAAPEMIAGKKYNGDRVDVWSCGVVLYAMVCGYLPFEDPVTKKLYKKIMTADYELPRFISNGAKDLINKILNVDEDERYTISNIMNHPWFNRVSTFPWPLSSVNGDLEEEDIQEYLLGESCGGVNVEKKPVPVNDEIIAVLKDYGCNQEYAEKCVQMNKHNSVTSTYYLLLKHKKGEYITELESKGKNFNKYYEVCNEKQELMDLLMDYEPSKKKKRSGQKVIEINHNDENEMMEEQKERKERKERKPKTITKVNNIEIVPKSKSQERRVKKKQDVSMEYKTIDHGDMINLKEMDEPKPEFQTVDNMSANTRNNIQLPHTSTSITSSKRQTNKNITYIKNRRTGSTDCTNTKLNKREIKRISDFQKTKAVVDLDTDEGEIIVSNRQNLPDRNSPSPSPVKYNIEPNKNKVFDMNYIMKNSNYESVKNKKPSGFVFKQMEEGKVDYTVQKKKNSKNKSQTKLVVRKGGKEYFIKGVPHLQNLKKIKGSREKRDFVHTTIGSTSNNAHNEALISKSVDSSKNDKARNQNFETERISKQGFNYNQFKTFYAANPTYTNNIEKEIRNKIQRKTRMKIQNAKMNDSKERNVRDSPYVSSYNGKISKRKSKEDRSSKESLNRNSKKKSSYKRSSKRSKQEMLGCVTGKSFKPNFLHKNNSSTMSKKIKVKSSSHNGRKKSKKSNLNNTFKDTEMLENILRMSNPNKSNSKLNQTLAFYRHGGHNSQVKYSNRDYLSKNSRSTKKKGLNYMKQMMNKTVLIQNQDYAVGKGAVVDFNPQQLATKGFIKNDILKAKSKERNQYFDIKGYEKNIHTTFIQNYPKDNYQMIDGGMMGEDMEGGTQKRANSHEGRSKCGSVQGRVPNSALERNCTFISYGNDKEKNQESVKRGNTGGGKRQTQPRQNPFVGNSPKNPTKSLLTPSQKKD